MPYQPLELLGGLFTIPFLVYACYSDIRIREVDDEVWLVFLAVALPMNLIRLFLYREEGSILLIGLISIILGIFLAFFLVGLGLWGGADGKAFICISLISPLPIVSELSLFEKIIPLSLTFFMNAYLLLIPLPLLIFFFNVFRFKSKSSLYRESSSSVFRKFFTLFIGWPESLSSIKKRHHWHYDFLEKKVDLQWKISFGMKLGDPEEDLQRRKDIIIQLDESGRTAAWIQPSLPFLLPMTIGYYGALLAENLMVQVIALLL
ncbi:MAG: prepilin peptidase [Promethearchaeota archaeon]